MNTTYESYDIKLDKILFNLRSKNVVNEDKNVVNEDKNVVDEDKNVVDEDKNVVDEDKNVVEKDINKNISKQFDTLNYCYEMHKVRKNKKANFDIYSSNTHDIEDDNIDKCKKFMSWKDLDNITKNTYIDIFVSYLYNKYDTKISECNIKSFILENKTKIQYDKIENKIDDILGMYIIKDNNTIILSMKKKNNNSNVAINKLRKSIKNSFKNNK